jgi:predicted ATPase
MIGVLAIAGYRSIRSLALPLARLTVVTGPNGSGKSSLYRALRLLAHTASGNLVGALAREGGLQSTFWAGPEQIGRAMRSGRVPIQGTVRREAMRLLLGFGAEDLSFAVDLGYPIPGETVFDLDPAIKRECIWSGPSFRPGALLVDRRGPSLRAVGASGEWETIPGRISAFESMMTEFSDPRSAPEMIAIRQRLRAFRFYDNLRADIDAPCRRPQVGTHTPALADDGGDLAAAVQTIREIGDSAALDEAVEDAFPGSSITTEVAQGLFEVAMRQHGLLRPLRAAELSDGTLRYLMLVAALLSPRPPELLALNEPETSLHPDLVPALARLIASASARSQVIVVSHSRRLVDLLAGEPDSTLVELEKQCGETRVREESLLSRLRWEWPPR